MFKKLGLAMIIALTFCFAGFAKTNINSETNNFSSGSSNEELVNKLISDIDFKNYYISNVKFANKVIETKSGALFYKYIQNKATGDEQKLLFKQMGVVGKKEFDAIAIKKFKDAKALAVKFETLQRYSPEECKSILKEAFKKIEEDKSIPVKLVNPQECFYTWAACTTLCFIGCNSAENFSECMWGCEAYCSGIYAICWFIEE